MVLHRHGARLVELGANTAAVTSTAVGLAGFVLHGGASIVRRAVEAVAWGQRHRFVPEWPRGSQGVRHHYVCQCVPPCYECHR